MFICTYRKWVNIHLNLRGDLMPVTIDTEKCGKISNCPGEGLCIKLCEKGALIEEDGDVVIVSVKL